MKINVNKEELEFILKDYYGIKGLEVEKLEFNGEFISIETKDYNPPTIGEVQYRRKLQFLKKYYEKFGNDAPYPFLPENPNENKGFSMNFYEIKINNI